MSIDEFVTLRQLEQLAPDDAIDMVQEAASRVAIRQTKALDETIMNRLLQILGNDGWTHEDLRGRLEVKVTPDHVDWYCLDGAAFMKAAPARHERDGQLVTVTRKLWKVHHPLESA